MKNWTSKRPTESGWYWCKNGGDRADETWVAVVRVDRIGERMVCSWMTAPGSVGLLAEENWSKSSKWSGPIEPPK